MNTEITNTPGTEPAVTPTTFPGVTPKAKPTQFVQPEEDFAGTTVAPL